MSRRTIDSSIAGRVSDEALRFVQHCQQVAGSWHDASMVGTLSSLWRCLADLPKPRTLEDRVALSSTLLRLALGALERTASRSTSVDSIVVAGLFGPLTRRASPHARVSQLLRLVAVRFREPHLTLSGLAATLGLSQSHLSRAIHRETGQPFSTHLNGFRLLAAIVMLRATSLSIKEIAGSVGYTRTSELDRQCHRMLHMTPNQIRHAVHGHVAEAKRLPGRVQAAVGSWRTRPAEIADVLDIDLGFVLRLRGMPSRR